MKQYYNVTWWGYDFDDILNIQAMDTETISMVWYMDCDYYIFFHLSNN